MPIYNVTVPIDGVYVFLNVEASSPEEAVERCKARSTPHEQKKPRWEEAEITIQLPRPPLLTPKTKRKRKHPRPAAVVDWEKYDPLLGKIADAEIARQAGCSNTAVSKRRIAKKINPVRARNNVDWEFWDHMLGTMWER